MNQIRTKYALLGIGILIAGFVLNYARVHYREERTLVIISGPLFKPGARERESALIELKRDRPKIERRVARLLLNYEETVTRLVWEKLPGSIQRRLPEPFSAEHKRKIAVTAIGMLGSPLSLEVEAALRNSCWQTNPFIRNRAAVILGCLGESTALTLKAIENVQTYEVLDRRDMYQSRYSEFNLIPGSTEGLVRSLRAPFFEARYRAADRLSSLGTNALIAVPALIGSLDDTNEMVISASIRALGSMGRGARAAIPRLKEFTTSDGFLSQHATRALHEIQE